MMNMTNLVALCSENVCRCFRIYQWKSTLTDVKFTVVGSAFQTFIILSTKNFSLVLAVHLGLYIARRAVAELLDHFDGVGIIISNQRRPTVEATGRKLMLGQSVVACRRRCCSDCHAAAAAAAAAAAERCIGWGWLRPSAFVPPANLRYKMSLIIIIIIVILGRPVWQSLLFPASQHAHSAI